MKRFVIYGEKCRPMLICYWGKKKMFRLSLLMMRTHAHPWLPWNHSAHPHDESQFKNQDIATGMLKHPEVTVGMVVASLWHINVGPSVSICGPSFCDVCRTVGTSWTLVGGFSADWAYSGEPLEPGSVVGLYMIAPIYCSFCLFFTLQ